jgi:hypothetical protein
MSLIVLGPRDAADLLSARRDHEGPEVVRRTRFGQLLGAAEISEEESRDALDAVARLRQGQDEEGVCAARALVHRGRRLTFARVALRDEPKGALHRIDRHVGASAEHPPVRMKVVVGAAVGRADLGTLAQQVGHLVAKDLDVRHADCRVDAEGASVLDRTDELLAHTRHEPAARGRTPEARVGRAIAEHRVRLAGSSLPVHEHAG